MTPAALELAKTFANQVPGLRSGGWIVTFSWSSARSILDRKSGTTTDLGPGLDLGAHRLHEVPTAALIDAGGLNYALQIPPEVVATADKKMIDVDPSSRTGVLLL